MPSTICKSSKFIAAGGIALSDSDVQEQSNGLVTASLNYTIDPSQLDRFNFSLDAQPPIYPRGYSRERLQSGLFFMVDRSISYENGLVRVQAKYAGALNVAQESTFISAEYENRTYGYTVQSTPASGFGDGLYVTVNFTGDVRDYLEDYYKIEARLKFLTYETCVINSVANVIFSPPAPEDLISSARYLQKYMPMAANRIYAPPADAKDFLTSKRVGFYVTSEEDVSHVTPTVKIYRVTFIPEPLNRGLS